MERQRTELEKVFAADTDKRSVSKACKQLMQLDTKTPSSPIRKRAEDLCISPKTHRGQQARGKMSNSAN